MFYALKDICEKNSNANINFEYISDVSTGTRYQEEFEMKMYFMITELLNNIMKHSHGSEAKLTLLEKGKELTVIVADNGRGFDMNDLRTIEGFGLHQIRARINRLNGQLIIKSNQKKGTTITITTPVKHKKT